jgi:alpha-L-rhamnosidase
MDIKQIYLDADAMLEGHFKLSSGNHSQYYLQSAKVLEDPATAALLANALADQIRNEVHIDTIAVGAISEADHANSIIAAGRADLARQWRTRADTVRAAVHREFFNPEDASYVNGFQAYLSIALLVNLPPADVRPAVWQRLEREIREKRKGHFWGGITGGAFVVKNLIAAGRNDLMCLMARQTDYPSWGHMLKQGATTIWEDWEGKLSQSHSSYLHIGMWFIEGLAGIQPGDDADGYRTFYLRPACDGSVPLSWVRCRQETPYGVIQSNWRRDGNRVTLDLIVPPNTTATLEVAVPGKLQSPKGDAGITRLPASGALQRLRLAPGHYRFAARP